jgi:hypothetical protein
MRNGDTGQLQISPVPSGFLEASPEAQAWSINLKENVENVAHDHP